MSRCSWAALNGGDPGAVVVVTEDDRAFVADCAEPHAAATVTSVRTTNNRPTHLTLCGPTTQMAATRTGFRSRDLRGKTPRFRAADIGNRRCRGGER